VSAATLAAEPDEPVKPPARARLTPIVEPPARPLAARGPLPGAPRLAGSRDGRQGPTRTEGAVDGAPLPDPTPLCCAMVQAAVEALRGTRPLAQLARWVSPEIYEQLAMRSELTQRVLGRTDVPQRAAIRRIRLCRLGREAAEATVVVDDGPRVRAVAVRLEGHRGQWRATALEIG
jgi:Family of unknown function (DUF6459)